MNIKFALRTGMLILAVALIVSGCAPAPGAVTPLPQSMKGYEIYSWQQNSQWYFTLITGANRNKTLAEITSAENSVTGDGWVKISAKGVDAFLKVLGGLPRGEALFWVGRIEPAPGQGSPLALPPQEMIDAIQGACKRSGLELNIVK